MKFTWLKEFFQNFLLTHRMLRHFRASRLGQGVPVRGQIPPKIAQNLLNAANQPITELLQSYNSGPQGISAQAAEALLGQVGPNEIEHEKPLLWYRHLWLSFRNPFNLLLSLLALVSYITADYGASIIISFMVLLATILRFIQEFKAERASDSLKAMVSNKATILRPEGDHPLPLNAGAPGVEMNISKLVPGDVLKLAAGDMIPADCRLLLAKDLFINQASMSGESMPVEKFSQPQKQDKPNLLDLDTILFMGSSVVSGSALALVLATGPHTYLGALATQASACGRGDTAFQAGINRISWLLIRFMLCMAPVVLLINGFTKGDWWEALLFALSIAVGLTPEMLPMIVTSTLAKGALTLSHKKVIVKRLDSIHNFGAMDILCTDKTGTITQDKIILSRHVDPWGKTNAEVFQMAYLNSYYQTGLKNLLDVAVLEHGNNHPRALPSSEYSKLDEIPFDFERRRMSVVMERKGLHYIICKGALEEILAICSQVKQGKETVALTPPLIQELRAITEEYNRSGLRVVAVAGKEIMPEKEHYGVADENGLVLIGYIIFLDPPKESAAPAIQALARHGVRVKVLTGDNHLVTANICGQVGLGASSQAMLSGEQVEAMDDERLLAIIDNINIFAKLTPNHKSRIVSLLKSKGHVVGFMGDGINDAAAMRMADISISVESAVDIAKEAADIILLEKDLMVLEQGVREGRRTFANMLKYIKMTTSSNFGNVFSVLVASAFLPFLPMLPLHLLTQNLLYDLSQTSIPFDNVDEEELLLPQKWSPLAIMRFMLFFGPISSLFDILTFIMMWFVFNANTLGVQSLFQSGWFVVGLFTQTLIVHMIRTGKLPFIESRASAPLMIMTIFAMSCGLFIVMGPFAHYFKLQALPLLYFAFLPAIVLCYMFTVQAMKKWYIKRFGWQ